MQNLKGTLISPYVTGASNSACTKNECKNNNELDNQTDFSPIYNCTFTKIAHILIRNYKRKEYCTTNSSVETSNDLS